MNNNNFRIDSVGFYRNRKGEKVEIIYPDRGNGYWSDTYGCSYFEDGKGITESDIIAKWEDAPQINSDNSKVNANALERIAELEGALRGLLEDAEVACMESGDDIWSSIRIAKKALGEDK